MIKSVSQPSAAWRTNHRKFYDYAIRLSIDLVPAAEAVLQVWPDGAQDALPLEQQPQGLHELCLKRNILSDSTKLFAAIAVEAFINFYGTVQLGSAHFTRTIERKPLDQKLLRLLHECDGIELPHDDELLKALSEVTSRRNALAHPKSIDTDPNEPPEARCGPPIPEDALHSVEAMRRFFHRFIELIPDARPLIPVERVA